MGWKSLAIARSVGRLSATAKRIAVAKIDIAARIKGGDGSQLTAEERSLMSGAHERSLVSFFVIAFCKEDTTSRVCITSRPLRVHLAAKVKRPAAPPGAS